MSNVFDIVVATTSAFPQLDRYNNLFNLIAPQYGVPPNWAKAHAYAENAAANPNAVGSSGRGLGIMQIDWGTYQDASGAWWYSSVHGKTNQVFDPYTNIKIACRDFLALILAAFGDNARASAAAYNAGIQAVLDAIANGSDPRVVCTPRSDGNYVDIVIQTFESLKATSHLHVA